MPRLLLFLLLVAILVFIVAYAVKRHRNRKQTLVTGKPVRACAECGHSDLDPSGSLNCYSPLFEESGYSPELEPRPCSTVRGTNYCSFKRGGMKNGELE
ncbi:MAG: hypothetical protein LBH36_01035 [Candidatus Nomurabacteria bacterium]|jgi:hypothetical protein|nr:hypothetical protein [Candidatus Nomurabacteria bacterium]